MASKYIKEETDDIDDSSNIDRKFVAVKIDQKIPPPIL